MELKRGDVTPFQDQVVLFLELVLLESIALHDVLVSQVPHELVFLFRLTNIKEERFKFTASSISSSYTYITLAHSYLLGNSNDWTL